MRTLLLLSALLTPLEVLGEDCGQSSWYERGSITANGERFDPTGLTVAHRTLPFNTKLKVKHKNKTVIVRVNDRGPFVKGRKIDLSKGAARALGIKDQGVVITCFSKV